MRRRIHPPAHEAGSYPWPAPEIRTVEWIARWTAHELAHHLFDSRRLLYPA